ncbi:unnamed protein product [Nippostrongylus brasiliensis]|uniref:UmuC domain-containing protein n=1 Tax=Nippostrongylus brasiliensis TaxID=27835 RepID=A0A0N4XUW1_NIPBR|nr:unnamed protein product [Nippostrongylus brasiliensis]
MRKSSARFWTMPVPLGMVVADHPAYCAKACFNRMDRRNKRLLFEKRLPWDFINRLEEDLISFFSSPSPTTPSKDDAVYVGAFGSSFERAIGHAVAQFLMLKSKS